MFRTDAELKEAYAERLKKEGQGVSIDVPADEYGGTIDVLTEREIIFCALVLDRESAIALQSKLNFYSRLAPSREKVAVVQTIIDADAANQLGAAGIRLVTVPLVNSSPVSAALPVGSKSRPRTQRQKHSLQKAVYRYPALNSVEGGDGLPVVAITFVIIFLIGLLGIAVL